MLEARRITKFFHAGTPNEVRPLQGVSLTMPAQSFTIVIGTNGCGKTSLLNAMAGTFFLDAGSIHLEGQDITHWPEHRRAAFIGRVFQNPFSGTAPNMTIAENFALAVKRGLGRGLGRALQRRLLDELAGRVRSLNMGLENRLQQAIGSLSGGQRQALTLLMATWRKPSLLLLDEHTAALDPKSADQVIRLTDRLVSEQGLTTLMVTHSMQQAVHLGERLIMMHRGRIVYDADGADKQRLRAADLLDRFEDLRRQDLLDPSAADVLRAAYV
jgi:putative tryptophan/tyrosine transport system ATP-binding protein